jgi:ATP-dependent Clp protease adaptor protein ClpS
MPRRALHSRRKNRAATAKRSGGAACDRSLTMQLENRRQRVPEYLSPPRQSRLRERTMSKIATKRQVKTEPRVERPRLHKVILFNDDYTPREFVVEVLKAVFRLNETQALNVMMTAHRKGVCVVVVLAQDIAETKAARGTEAGAAKGYPLRFGTEPEE